MNWKGIANVLSVVLLICSAAIATASLVSYLTDDPGAVYFLLFTYSLFLAILSSSVFLLTRGGNELGTREGFLIVVLGWVTIVTAGAFPFYMVVSSKVRPGSPQLVRVS
mgnify:CR=1 FL=1